MTGQPTIGAQLIGFPAINGMQAQCLDMAQDGLGQRDRALADILMNEIGKPSAQVRGFQAREIVEFQVMRQVGHGVFLPR